MTSSSDTPVIGSLPLDAASRLPLQEQLYLHIRDAIAEGRLAPGDRLPSTRSLAAQLNVSRGTVGRGLCSALRRRQHPGPWRGGHRGRTRPRAGRARVPA